MSVLGNQIKRQTKRAFDRYINKTNDHMQSYIIEEKRPYTNDNNNITIRRFGRGVTGQIAGSPRDVVDSGNTADSNAIIDLMDSSNKVEKEIIWDSVASVYVYRGTDKQPEYPWVEISLRVYDHEKEFQKEFK